MNTIIRNVPTLHNGIMDKSVRFVLANQLKNADMWKKFTEVFITREDSENERWRGEYFGKQMRGAVLTYLYTRDEELYDILTDAVVDLLSSQDEFGRFSTYNVENEFKGWDTWCRKYVLVGLLYYCKIAKDIDLRNRILSAAKKHLDYIIEKIGDGEGKICITKTSSWWGCVNSCTILEPTLELYKATKEKKYLDFAEYIISTGGCNDCNLVDLAFREDIYPYQYPVTKAYEMMSFYEGLLAYYEVTGEVRYFEAVSRFMDKVAQTDLTIIGCSGCMQECFDNSSITQTEAREDIMQETCVTVTWMRVNRRLFELTGDTKYIDRLEISGFNALYGSLNTEMNEQWCAEIEGYLKGKVFDSYSPLYMNVRGRGIGGYNDFLSGDYSGCCIAIGACAVALMPLTAIMQVEEKIYINLLFNGTARLRDKNGKNVCIHMESNYPADGYAKIIIQDDCCLKLYIRKPRWCSMMQVNGKEAEDSYFVLDQTYTKGDCIEINMQMNVQTYSLHGKVSFAYGPLVLATDEQKTKRQLKKPISLENIKYQKMTAKEGEIVRFACELEGEDEELILTDYQSCGKKWLSDKALMTAWFDRNIE